MKTVSFQTPIHTPTQMKNLRTLLIAAILFAVAVVANAQSVGINSDGSAPNSSAMLDVSSTTKGFLAPRMTSAQRTVITSPVAEIGRAHV